MSTHAMIAAAYVEELAPAAKLVLMAFADSSDEHSREAAPGLPKLRAWSNLGKSQALATVKRLVDDGYLIQLEKGRIGRRATYLVFPRGIPPIPHPTEVAARYSPTPPTPVDNRPERGSGSPDALAERGSDLGPRGSGRPDPFMHTLQSSTRARTQEPPRQRVDKSTRGGGFPGTKARPKAPPTCPLHPQHEQLYCPACAAAALPPDEARERAARVRAIMSHQRQDPTP